jgi:putative ABC transport system permease protein
MGRLKGEDSSRPALFMRPWLFRRFIVRRLSRNPIRAFLLVTAIAVATTLIASVYRVSVAGVHSFEESLGFSPQDYPLVIAPRGGGIQLSELGACLAPLRTSFAFAAYRREAGELTTRGTRHAAAIIGIGGFQDQGAQSALAGEIRLSHEAQRRFGLTPGDLVEITTQHGTVQGPVEPASTIGNALPSDGLIIPLSRLFSGSRPPVVDAILVRPYGDKPLVHYQHALTQWLLSCGALSAPIQVDTSTSRIERGESLVAAYRFNVMIMASMALLVCTLLVSQATQLSLRNLSRELSVLRTLGVERAACMASVVQEAAMLAGLGALLGVTVGEPLTVWITQLFLQTAHDIYNISLGAAGHGQLIQAAIVVCGMVAVSSVGAAFGGLDALRVAPSLGTRSEHTGVKPIAHRWALLVALTTTVSCLLIALIAIWTESTLFAYLFVAGCIGAVAGVTPYVIVVASRWLSVLPGSVLVWFAQGGIKTRGRGFLLGAVGASLGMSLICALSLMVGSFRETLDRWAAQRLHGDLFVSAALEGQGNESRIPAPFEDNVRTIRGVSRVVPYFETMTTYRDHPLVVAASDVATQIDRGVYVVRAGNLDRELLRTGRAALISESAARKLKLSVGDVISLEGTTLPVVAVIQEFGTEHPLVHVDRSLFRSLYPAHDPKNLTIDTALPEAIADIRADLQKRIGVVGIVRDNRELRTLVLTLFDRTFQVTLSVRWIVFGIALLGLLLASLQHLWERRREIKTMHVLGFSPYQIIGAQVVEMTVVCALPVCVGLLGGGFLGWGLTALVNPRSFGWSLHFSLSLTPVLIAIGFIVGVALAVGLATRSMLATTIKEAKLADE